MHLTWCAFRPIAFTFTVSVTAATLEAQSPRLSVGAGLSIPTGGYGTNDNTGELLLGAVVVPSPVPNFLFRLDGMYSVTTHQGGDRGHTKIAGGSAGVLWRLRRAGLDPHPYLLASLGFYDVMTTYVAAICYSAYCTSSHSQTALGWSGGGGLELLQLGPAIGFAIEARYVTIRSGPTTNLFPVTLGLVFGTR